MTEILTRPVVPPLSVHPATDCRPALPPVCSRDRPPTAQPPLPRSEEPQGVTAGSVPKPPTVLWNRWSTRPAPHLPDPGRWSVTLAWALLETLAGQRPVAQLSRWVDETVLGVVALRLRQRGPKVQTSQAPVHRPVLRSVRIQCPHPDAVEVAAHLLAGDRSLAMAFRLQAWCDRWICTALELGPGGADG